MVLVPEAPPMALQDRKREGDRCQSEWEETKVWKGVCGGGSEDARRLEHGERLVGGRVERKDLSGGAVVARLAVELVQKKG